jgi:hypothetical protein
MLLEGSCHCGAVKFKVESKHPYPFNLCYCGICRKTGGSGGFGVNLSGNHDTMEIQGEENISTYQAIVKDHKTGKMKQSEAHRTFCKHCGSALWVWGPSWPDLVHPHASAINTDLPIPPERTHLLLASKASWVEPHADPQDKLADHYPDESIEAWHKRLGLEM